MEDSKVYCLHIVEEAENADEEAENADEKAENADKEAENANEKGKLSGAVYKAEEKDDSSK